MGRIVPPTQRSAVPTNASEFGSAGAVAAAAGGGASGGAIASARDARSSAPAFEAALSASPAAATGGAAAAALSAGALAGGAQPLLQAAPLPQAKSCCDPGCAGAYGGCGCGCACGSALASGARANSAREFIGVVMDAMRDDPAYDSGRSSATITGERILEPDVAAKRGELSFIYRYISRESCSQFDSLPLTSLTVYKRQLTGCRCEAPAAR